MANGGAYMIVPVTLDKLEVLHDLARQTFSETFTHYRPEDLQEYLDTRLSLERLKEEVLNPESQQFFVLADGKEVGFLTVNVGSAQTEHELDNAFEVERIYILKAYQSKGLGKQLFEYAIQLAQQTDLEWMWLGVWEHNTKAQKLYQAYGFEKFSQHEFVVGDKVDCDWMMRKKIER